jgi:indolepyruvate ferredoxin oxidoreductase beta subunit
MAASGSRPISILIAALGGQGGGVLTEWIVAAADHAGYPVQSTSIPGVAQRTGATTYYVEVFPERAAAGAEPVFSLYPTAGDVDVIIASELLEAARTVELDYASPDRTLVVASTHRLFAIGEKVMVGNGVFPEERLREAVHSMAKKTIVFDALAAARRAQSEVNAVLLGALAAAGDLPMAESDFETAIREGGVAVERNLAGFKAGQEIVALADGHDERPPVRVTPPSDVLKPEVRAEFPAALHATLGEAVARLVDYQDASYADEFLARVRLVRAARPGLRLTEVFARRLAVWMSYEDAIRVADLKTRRGRFDRIRRENGVPATAGLVVTDYLKPDLDEIYGILPGWIGAPIARWAERRWPNERPTIAQHVRTTTVLGFARVWALGRLRRFRRSSLRARWEFALIDRWQREVLAAAVVDEALASEVADLATVVRGYGAVRRRLSAAFVRALDEILVPSMERDRSAGGGYARSARLLAEARQRLLEDENGLDAALASARS